MSKMIFNYLEQLIENHNCKKYSHSELDRESAKLDELLEPTDVQIEKIFKLLDDKITDDFPPFYNTIPFNAIYNKCTNPKFYSKYPHASEFIVCQRVSHLLQNLIPKYDEIFNDIDFKCETSKDQNIDLRVTFVNTYIPDFYDGPVDD